MIPIISSYLNVKKNDRIPLYGAKKIKIGSSNGNVFFNHVIYISSRTFQTMGSIEFPIINGKSPEYLTITSVSGDSVEVDILIEEFGGKPSATYFEDGA